MHLPPFKHTEQRIPSPKINNKYQHIRPLQLNTCVSMFGLQCFRARSVCSWHSYARLQQLFHLHQNLGFGHKSNIGKSKYIRNLCCL